MLDGIDGAAGLGDDLAITIQDQIKIILSIGGADEKCISGIEYPIPVDVLPKGVSVPRDSHIQIRSGSGWAPQAIADDAVGRAENVRAGKVDAVDGVEIISRRGDGAGGLLAGRVHGVDPFLIE